MEIAVILGIAAPVVAFVAFLCTIITAYQSLQFRHMVEEAENQVMDLLDEALQIMIPAGICKRISVNTNGMQLDNFDSKVFVKRQREIPILIDYPQDLSAEIASGERLYGELGVVSTEKYVEHYCRVEVELALKGSQKRSSSQKGTKRAKVDKNMVLAQTQDSHVNIAAAGKRKEYLLLMQSDKSAEEWNRKRGKKPKPEVTGKGTDDEEDFVPPKKKSKKPKAEASAQGVDDEEDFVPPKKKSKKPKAEASARGVDDDQEDFVPPKKKSKKPKAEASANAAEDSGDMPKKKQRKPKAEAPAQGVDDDQEDFVPPKKKSKKPKAEASANAAEDSGEMPKKKQKKPKAEATAKPAIEETLSPAETGGKKKSKKPKAEATAKPIEDDRPAETPKKKKKSKPESSAKPVEDDQDPAKTQE
ncbi:hypothetical protein Q1695_003434 [Nippostrongylus brasiliensis]|nr:hypothetical protein Q1695_003434 [Nippostrongylus brasiliensis]